MVIGRSGGSAALRARWGRLGAGILGALCVLAPAAWAKDAREPALMLRLAKEGWGDADLSNVEAVLRSAGRELLRQFPSVTLPALEVHPRGGPITLFKRADDGAIVVKLDTGDRFWAQYAFQFSHELCHVLCRFTPRDSGNKWFEESLCEAASLFVLRRMGETWKTDPPYRNWKPFAAALTKYADERLGEFKLPPGTSLAQWHRANGAAMAKEVTNRKLNGVVAAALAGLFERSPQDWAAVSALNEGIPSSPETFAQCLQRWHDHAPRERRAFIREVGKLFEIELQE